MARLFSLFGFGFATAIIVMPLIVRDEALAKMSLLLQFQWAMPLATRYRTSYVYLAYLLMLVIRLFGLDSMLYVLLVAGATITLFSLQYEQAALNGHRRIKGVD